MDFFTSKQSVDFSSNYGTFVESRFSGATYESRSNSYATEISTVTGSGSTSQSSYSSRYDQSRSNQYQYSQSTEAATQYTDTTFTNSYTETGGYTIFESVGDTSSFRRETIGADIGATTFTNTQLGYQTGTTLSIGQVGLLSFTSNLTGTWNNYITSTSSYTISTISTTTGSQTSYSTSLSKWETINSNSTIGTSLSTTYNTSSSITYPYTTSTQGSNLTFTKTNHFRSPLVDTVILANAGKNITNYNIGNQIWEFSNNLAAISSGSTFGRFFELFSSTEADYLVLPYQTSRTTSRSIAATAITFSRNTRNTTYSGGTIIQYFTSYNSVEYTASANSKTETITINIGDVSTSVSGTGTNTGIEFYSTRQISGYNASNSFTTATETQWAYSSSTTTQVNKFWNSAQSTEFVNSRKTATNEILYSYYLTSGTNFSFVGLKKTTTTNAYLVETTFTYPFWDGNLNPVITRYTTNSNSTNASGGEATGQSIGETLNLTYYTITNVSPAIWTNPDYTQEDIVVFQVPAIGYAGVGGNITGSNLAVYSSISIGLIGGGTYGTEQTLNTNNLPTAFAYDDVTIFPDSIYSTNYPYGAYSMRYISTDTSIGSRLVGVTWSTTTQAYYTLKDITGGSTITTTQTNVAKPATYSIAPVGLITGDFYSSGQITFNTNDVRMSNNFSGGFALGNNAIGNDYTVSLGLGYVEWTAYNSTGSVSSNQSQGIGNIVSFTVPSSLAIVLNAEPILSMSWKEGNDTLDHISQSYQYFPT